MNILFMKEQGDCSPFNSTIRYLPSCIAGLEYARTKRTTTCKKKFKVKMITPNQYSHTNALRSCDNESVLSESVMIAWRDNGDVASGCTLITGDCSSVRAC